jgi:hypothetical protein
MGKQDQNDWQTSLQRDIESLIQWTAHGNKKNRYH